MAADTRRTPPVAALLPAALLLPMLALAAVFLPMMGMRPDFAAAMMRVPVMVKQAVPLLLALGAFGAALRLSRPGAGPGGWALLLAAVPALLLVAVAGELMILPEAEWMPAMMGSSNGQCVGFITVMALPLLAGTLWALRRGASTRPALSGAAGRAAERRRGGAGLLDPLHRGQPAFLRGLVRSGDPRRHRARRASRVAAAALVGFFVAKCVDLGI